MNQANASVNPQSPEASNPRKRKRQATEVGSQPSEAQPHHSGSLSTSLNDHLPGLYDHLSNIRLTKRALKEFDRRIDLLPKPVHLTAPAQTDALPLRRGEILADLQRFARNGGPDLSDLRGIPHPASVPLAHTQDRTQDSSKLSAMPPQGDSGTTDKVSVINSTSHVRTHCKHDITHDATCTRTRN